MELMNQEQISGVDGHSGQRFRPFGYCGLPGIEMHCRCSKA